MPEGDTVHKLARAMRPHLEGRSLARLWLRERGEVRALRGWRVDEIAALGKHLLVVIGEAPGQYVVHVHLGMRGRWHRYAPGEPWRWRACDAAVSLTTRDDLFVCFRAAIAEGLRRVDVPTHPGLSRLGPDLLAPEPTFRTIVARARRREPRSAAELLLDQGVACGIGNVYKSEVLFLEGVHPETRSDRLSDPEVERLYRRGRELLGWNLGGWRRTTLRRVASDTPVRRGEPRLWVYDRAGRPCLRCGARIEVARRGDEARATYWCPGCQPARGAAPT